MMQEFDAIVAGAGTTGAWAARELARRGLTTALLDARSFSESGARWVNGVAPWLLERAGVPLPEPPELRRRDFPFAIYGPTGRRLFSRPICPAWNLDMRLLGERLRRMAAEAGVTMIESVRPAAFDLDSERPRVLRVESTANGGETHELSARLFVDAGGFPGALRPLLPALAKTLPELGPGDICGAAQQVREIRDADGAREYLGRHGAHEGEAMSFVGIEGGFSTITVKIERGLREMEILAGSLADGRHRTGAQLIEDFVAARPWVGPVLFGGGALIPLRRPFDRFAAPGIALVGNTACQVFPAHGSGIGSGLVAAEMLARAAAEGSDPGSERAMADYQCRFQREMGSVHAAYDVFRRGTQDLPPETLDAVLGSGLTRPAAVEATLAQVMTELRFGEKLEALAAALRHPKLTALFVPILARMRTAFAHYKRYPRPEDAHRLPEWSAKTARIFHD